MEVTNEDKVTRWDDFNLVAMIAVPLPINVDTLFDDVLIGGDLTMPGFQAEGCLNCPCSG